MVAFCPGVALQGFPEAPEGISAGPWGYLCQLSQVPRLTASWLDGSASTSVSLARVMAT